MILHSCPACDEVLDVKANFCGYCGRPVPQDIKDALRDSLVLAAGKQTHGIVVDQNIDAAMSRRVDEVFHGENVVQTILHAHLLVERALTLWICEKLKRPDVIESGRFGRWSFQQKLGLYVALYDPPEDRQSSLIGLNRLRNALAHGFDDEEAAISKFLPWKGSTPSPYGRDLLRVTILEVFFDLHIIKSIQRLDADIAGANAQETR